jgi:hypothetical protein
MRGIHEGMQETDGEALDPLALQELNLLTQRGLIEWHQHLAGIVQPFRHRDAPAAAHQRLRQFDVQVVLVVAGLIGQGEDVAEALRRDQRRLRALALNDRIRRERGAVDDEV